MGLDMYLYRTVKVDGLDGSGYTALDNVAAEQGELDSARWALSQSGLPGAEVMRNATRLQGSTETFTWPSIYEKVGYWRKANAIHNWFVQHVQEGVDDCGTYLVSQEQLRDLQALCQTVLREPVAAANHLPTVEGFFFGGTEYGEYYLRDLEDTIGLFDKVLATTDFDTQVVLYSSSW